MSVFPLLDPPQHLVERIIAKVDLKSNFRLRQTCHDLYDLIQTGTNVTVHVPGAYMAYYRNSIFEFYRRCRARYINPDGCYGIRLEELCLPLGSDGDTFEPVCEDLKKRHVTTEHLRLKNPDGWTQYSTEQCKILLKLLKPIQVTVMLHDGMDSLEPFLHSKILRKVTATVYQRDSLPVLRELLSRFLEVSVHIIDGPETFQFFREALQLFLSSPWPNLKKFRLEMTHDDFSTQEQLQQAFPDMHWILKEDDDDDEDDDVCGGSWFYNTDVELPTHFPLGSRCKIQAIVPMAPYTILELSYDA